MATVWLAVHFLNINTLLANKLAVQIPRHAYKVKRPNRLRSCYLGQSETAASGFGRLCEEQGGLDSCIYLAQQLLPTLQVISLQPMLLLSSDHVVQIGVFDQVK